MSIKWIGSVMIIGGSWFIGYSVSKSIQEEEYELQQLLVALDFMNCELQYHVSSLPVLLRLSANECEGLISVFLMKVASELDLLTAINAQLCMNNVLQEMNLSGRAKRIIDILAGSFGRFDMDGQLLGIQKARQHCCLLLEDMSKDKKEKRRAYQTLAICAGAALAILLV